MAGLPHIVSFWHGWMGEEEGSDPCLEAVGTKLLVECRAKTGPWSSSV